MTIEDWQELGLDDEFELEDVLMDACDIMGVHEEVDVRSHYSGRGMYGSHCVGYVTDDVPGLTLALVYVLVERCDVPWEDVHQYLPGRQDSMGLSAIVY